MASLTDDRQRVLDATDLVRLVGEHVALRPKGREFAGLCPFHEDKNPSMYVSPQKQIFKCFVCGAGGSAFDFVMRYHKMAFGEALRFLAERGGVELTPLDGAGGRGDAAMGERARIRQANEQALSFYRHLFTHAEHGRGAQAYGTRRGISSQMLAEFQIGYAPDGWEGLVQTVGRKKWDMSAFVAAGLVKARQGGSGHFDFLRHRLIFPIFDGIGRPIAFGGRKLRDEDEPKYINSPETRLFNKSQTLYGLHLAKKPIIDRGTAVLVEGYTDVIACHQAGARNVVAALGTALTGQHVAELRRYCNRVILVMDGDAAGQKAADRAIEVFLSGEMDVALAVLPGGQDPADFFAAAEAREPGQGLAQWETFVAGATDALQFVFDALGRQMGSTTTVAGRQQLIDAMLERLFRLGLDHVLRGSAIRRALIIQRLAAVLRLPEAEVNAEWIRRQQAAPRAAAPRATPRPAMEKTAPSAEPDFHQEDLDAWEEAAAGWEEARALEAGGEQASPGGQAERKAAALAEKQLIGGLLREGALFNAVLSDGRTLDEAIAPGDITAGGHRELYSWIHDALAEGQSLPMAGLLGQLAEGGRHDLSALVAEADAALDQACGGGGDSAERLREAVLAAAEHLLRRQIERLYREQRQSLTPGDGVTDEHQSALLRQLIEHQRSHPSAVRIARFRT